MPEMKQEEWEAKVKPEQYKLTMRKWIKLRIDPPYPDSETDPTTSVRLEESGSTKTVEARAGTSSSGPVLTVEEASGQGKIQQKVGENSALIDQQQIELKVGSNSIVINQQQIELKVGGNSIVLSQDGITIKGINITVQGQAKVEVKAPMVQGNADAMMQLKGGVVMIN